MTFKPASVSSLLLLGIVLLLTLLQLQGAHSIGVCYGLLGNNLPSRQNVINLYRSRNIKAMRLYGPDHQAFQALMGTTIELILDIPRESLQPLGSDAGAASQWVQTHIRSFYPQVHSSREWD
ncbi:unnamed protein product [Rhodiola kirilowii]